MVLHNGASGGSVQSLCWTVLLFTTPWTAACQASLSIANSWTLLKLIFFELVMPSNHLILCHPLLVSPLIFPSISVFSNESALHIRWPKYLVVTLIPMKASVAVPQWPVLHSQALFPHLGESLLYLQFSAIYHRGLGCKSRKSRDTWSYKEVWPWCTKWSKAKANRVLPREGTGHSKHPLLTTQELTLHMDNTR